MSINYKSLQIINPINFIPTVFYIGKIPFMPGTFGSLFATIDFILLYIFQFNNSAKMSVNQIFISPWVLTKLLIYITIVFVLGIFTSSLYEKKHEAHDPSAIVIDEYVGQYITFICTAFTLLLFSHKLPHLLFSQYEFLMFVLISFITFRFFDISKVELVGIVERKFHNGFGIMIDDVVAGIYASITTLFIIMIYILAFKV